MHEIVLSKTVNFGPGSKMRSSPNATRNSFYLRTYSTRLSLSLPLFVSVYLSHVHARAEQLCTSTRRSIPTHMETRNPIMLVTFHRQATRTVHTHQELHKRAHIDNPNDKHTRPSLSKVQRSAGERTQRDGKVGEVG